MADITVTLTDADQSNLQTQIDYVFDQVGVVENTHPSLAFTKLHKLLNTLALMVEDKVGVARGTYHGSVSGGGYLSPASGGTDKGP